ncbi:LysR family transcriptional regulator [Eggerthella sinensis]|uniref:LysR family transcriptional regulator n=1 Tax=Eggerthella sinensis TaxID=242230 RepID=UPI0022E7754E|nr:LysR family transcriptional regulator [Eggerthella sinensis]
MNLSQVRYFKKLAEVQHYTRAAKELFISQPTLSNSISQLERELGIPLFERENRAVRLTRYGEEFYAYASQALQLLDKGVAIAHEHAGSLSGTIEIGTVYSIQGDYLPALMSAYRAACGTAVTTNVSQGLTLPLVEDLERDRYEVVFAAHVPGKPKLTFVPVFEQRLVAIMHRRHPLAAADEVTFDDVHAAERLLSYPPQTPVGCEVARLLERHGIALAGPFYHDEITLASMVESTQAPSASRSTPSASPRSPTSWSSRSPASTTPSTPSTSCTRRAPSKPARSRASSPSPAPSSGAALKRARGA